LISPARLYLLLKAPPFPFFLGTAKRSVAILYNILHTCYTIFLFLKII